MPLRGCEMRSNSEGDKKIDIISRLIHLMRYGTDPKFADTERRLEELTRDAKIREDLRRMNGYGRHDRR